MTSSVNNRCTKISGLAISTHNKRGKIHINVTLRRIWFNHCCRRKAINITYSECVSVALVIQHAMCMSCIYWYLCPLWLYHSFPHYVINVMILEESYWTQNVFWFSVQLLSKTFLILRRLEQNIIIMCIGHNIKYQLFLSDFNQTWQIFQKKKKLKYQISWKSIHWELSCSMWTDGQTDMTKLRVTYCNF
jgi:hypothetical protein